MVLFKSFWITVPKIKIPLCSKLSFFYEELMRFWGTSLSHRHFYSLLITLSPQRIFLGKIVFFWETFTMTCSLCELILVGIWPASPYPLSLCITWLYSSMTLPYSEFWDLMSLCKPLLCLASMFWLRKQSLPQHCWSRGIVQVAQSPGWVGGRVCRPGWRILRHC